MIGSLGSVRFGGSPLYSSRSNQTSSAPSGAASAGLRDLLSQIRELSSSLNGLEKNSRFRDVSRGGQLGQLLNQTVTGTQAISVAEGSPFSTLTSEEEVNAFTTSYNTHLPTFDLASSASPIIDGDYDGRYGTTTLEFRATRVGEVGNDRLTFDVYDLSTNSRVDTIDFKAGKAAETFEKEKSGLELALSDGFILAGDRFQLNVRDDLGTDVDPDKPMNGIGFNDADLEHSTGVRDGFFRINGVQIDHLASESLNEVLQKITDSAAGVDATYDSLNDRVVLTARDPGASVTIDAANDNSRFLAATKLKNVNSTSGATGTMQSPLEEVAGLGALVSGDFAINGTVIQVDPAADSLEMLLTRINESGAGVEASYDSVSERFSIKNIGTARTLELGDGTSGLFGASGIAAGTYDPDGQAEGPQRNRRELSNRTEFEKRLRDVARKFNQIFDDEFAGSAAGSAGATRSRLETTLREAIAGSDAEGSRLFRSGLGIDLDAREDSRQRFRVDHRRLRKSLSGRQGLKEVENLLFGRGNRSGLVEDLREGLKTAEEQIETQLRNEGQRGSLFDIRA